MSDDDQDETLRQQLKQLQSQQNRRLQILQKRREEKERRDASDASSVGSGAAFGVVDDLDLNAGQPMPPAGHRQSFHQPNREDDQQAEQIREMKDEMGRLYKLLNERDFELRNSRKKLDDLQALQAAGVAGGDGAAATKIVELSKKVRELTAELEAERTRSKQLARKCLEAEKLASQVQSVDDARGLIPLNESMSGGSSDDARSLQEKLKQTELKLADYRNQVQSLKAELKVTQKVLAQEVGEGVQVQSLISADGQGGWRGRAQQIAILQKKVSDLKKQLQQVKSQSDAVTEFGEGLDGDELLTQRVVKTTDKQKETIRQMELKRKEAQEKMSADLKALEQENESLKQKADAAKARITILKTESQTQKQQLQKLIDKGRHDDELIDALLKKQEQLKEALEDSSKKAREGAEEVQQTKQELFAKQHDNNVIEQLKSIISEKEAKIRALERQLREVQADLNIERLRQQQQQADDDNDSRLSSSNREVSRSPADNISAEMAARIVNEALSPTPGQDSRGYSHADIERELARSSHVHLSHRLSTKYGQDEIKYHELNTLYQALTVEKDRLSQLVKVHEKRIQEATFKVAESLTELQAQRRRNAQLEKQAARFRIDGGQTADKLKGKNGTTAKGASTDELQAKLEIQRDENEALKAVLQSTLKSKEDDLKLYMDMIEETKKVFLQGIQQLRAKTSPHA